MISIRLKEFRERCGMTQRQIARVLQMDRSTYAYYETGKTSPDISTLYRLAQLFKISLDDLIGEIQDPDKPLTLHSPSIEYSVFSDNEKMFNLDDEEQTLVMYYRLLSNEKKRNLLEQLDDWIKKESEN